MRVLLYVPYVIRAGIYARISSDRDGEGLGVQRQLEDCEALASRKGWAVAERYVDSDVSAYSGRPRPEYERMLGDLAAGAIDGVVVWHLDRLHRRPQELETFFEVCERAAVKNLASVTGDVDLATHDGQFMARILGAVARKESDDKSRRIKRKHQELALAGRDVGGGTRPFGYESDRHTINRAEAAVVRECASRALAGESLRSIASDLNARRFPTVTRKNKWNSQTLRRILLSARISGQREHRGDIVATAQWPAIITPQQTASLRALLMDPGRRTNQNPRRYVLKGLLRCGRCGATLVSRPTDRGTRRYICAKGPNYTGCGHTFITAPKLEQFIAEAVIYRLDSPELAAALSGPAQSETEMALHGAIAADEAQLDQLAIDWADRLITRREWLAARQHLEGRLLANRRALARSTGHTALAEHVGRGGELRERWDSLNLSRQHAIIKAVLAHVVVGPGRPGFNGFDSGRLTPVWQA